MAPLVMPVASAASMVSSEPMWLTARICVLPSPRSSRVSVSGPPGAKALDVEHERPLDALRLDDLEVLTVELDVLAVRLRADEAPLAAGPNVHLGDAGRRAARAPPARDELRIGVGAPHRLARRWKMRS